MGTKFLLNSQIQSLQPVKWPPSLPVGLLAIGTQHRLVTITTSILMESLVCPLMIFIYGFLN